jgi:2-amino-4-hydroxy-6-hydroxymethyldihydropteridine diphosphokinase
LIAYIGLGANLGNRRMNLVMALRGLTRMARVDAVSSLYQTKAQGPEQPDYYNAVCRIETGLEAASLLRLLKALEHEIGRRDTGKQWAPRPIDLDLLLYDDAVLDEPGLVVPHPRMSERAFVMTPLAELAPDLHVKGRSAKEIAAALGTADVKPIAEAGWDGIVSSQQDVRL